MAQKKYEFILRKKKGKIMKKKVCLIDGSGYIFRAFYALPMLTSPQGVPVNAVLGFMNMFMRLTAKIKCDYCLVLFDAKRQNYRCYRQNPKKA